MARLLIPLLLFVAAGCSSSGAVGESQFFMQDYQQIFAAAEATVGDVGGRISASNPTSGTILGTIESAELGGDIRLYVTLRRPAPYGSGRGEGGADVTAVATMEGVGDDPTIAEELRDLEDRFMDILDGRLAEFAQRGRPGRGTEPGIPGQTPSDPWGGGGTP
jgi:hypothetical protein